MLPGCSSTGDSAICICQRIWPASWYFKHRVSKHGNFCLWDLIIWTWFNAYSILINWKSFKLMLKIYKIPMLHVMLSLLAKLDYMCKNMLFTFLIIQVRSQNGLMIQHQGWLEDKVLRKWNDGKTKQRVLYVKIPHIISWLLCGFS